MFTHIKEQQQQQREKKKEEKNRIFDLLRFYASDSSYSTQKQTRIMAPFASHTEA